MYLDSFLVHFRDLWFEIEREVRFERINHKVQGDVHNRIIIL